MSLMFPRKSSKIWNMNFAWLLLMVAVLLFPENGKPNAMANNSSVVTLNGNDIKILNKNHIITELYLNNNTIHVLRNSFYGLSELAILNISITENEKNIAHQDNQKIQTTTTEITSNNRRKKTEATTKLYISINPSNDTGVSACNDTDGKLLCSGFQPIGKSWRFLIGVLIVIVTTTLLIITAIKFPVWYRHLVSYNHSRLDEDEPGMYEENFSTDAFSFPPAPDTNENDSIVVFEQFHTFVPEEDGFIEDKYIDT